MVEAPYIECCAFDSLQDQPRICDKLQRAGIFGPGMKWGVSTQKTHAHDAPPDYYVTCCEYDK